MAPAAARQSSAAPMLGLRAIGITVRDMDKAIGWYRSALRLGEMRRFTLPAAVFGPDLLTNVGGTVEIVVAEAATGMLQFMAFSDGPPPPPSPLGVTGPGYTHLCLQSPATDPALPKLMGAGFPLVSRCDERGVDLGGYGIRYAYGRDPEGRMIEVEILDQPQRAESAWACHLANVVHDHSGMMAFYAGLLDMPPRNTAEQGGRPTFDAVAGIDDVAIRGAWFNPGGLELEVWHFTSPPTPAPVGRRRLDEIGYNAPLFEVTGIEAAVARLAGLGAQPIGPMIDLGGWATHYAVDPEGSLFCLQQRVGAPLNETVAAFIAGN